MPYVTPPSIPESTTCRALLIPDSTDWLAIFGGALTELIYKYNWEQVDGISVDDAIQAAVLVINGFYEGCVASGCNQPGGYGILRVNPEGHVEQLIDGEWVEPQGDNAFPAIPERTEPTPDERRCLAAANAANVLQIGYESLADSFAEGLTQAEAIINLIAAFAVLWFWFAPILNGLVLLLAGFLELVINAFEYVTVDAWDETFTDLVRCILYECASDDGEIVTFDFQCVLTKLSEQTIGGDWTEIRLRAAVQLTYLLYILGGADFLAQAGGTTAISDADCDDCEQQWCYFFDFTIDEQGWSLYPAANGSYSSGVGWITGDVTRGVSRTLIDIQLTFPMAGQVTNFGMDYEYVAGNQSSGIQAVVAADIVTPLTLIEENMPWTPLPSPTNAQIYWEGDDELQQLYVLLQTSIDVHGGSGVIKGITLHGTGENPFGEDNC